MTIEERISIIEKALDDKKASDITSIKVDEMTILTDYFVICSAKSTTQVKAIADNVEEEMTKVGFEPAHKEGGAECRWIVLDYGDIIVHIFYDETRMLYAFDKLWENGKNVEKFVTED
ncbi:MAG: ribosome silencing factor [Clostridia bacterium]